MEAFCPRQVFSAWPRQFFASGGRGYQPWPTAGRLAAVLFDRFWCKTLIQGRSGRGADGAKLHCKQNTAAVPFVQRGTDLASFCPGASPSDSGMTQNSYLWSYSMFLRSRPSTRNTVSGIMLAVSGILIMLGSAAAAQPADGWSHYGGSQHGLQYSPLSQINEDNVADLEEAWRFRTGEMGQGLSRPLAFEANPVLAEGRLYLSTGSAITLLSILQQAPKSGGTIPKLTGHVTMLKSPIGVLHPGLIRKPTLMRPVDIASSRALWMHV